MNDGAYVCRGTTLNPADYCSRHTSTDADSVASIVTDEYINFVVNHATPIAVTLQDIQSHTRNDPTLQALPELIKTEKWYLLDTSPQNYSHCSLAELKAYRKFQQEFTVTADNSLILCRNRLMVPISLRKRMLQLAHEAHLGVTKTKSILRDKIYFPGMDAQVEALLKSCLACTANARSDPPPPLQPSPLPPLPWHTVNIDFLGPLPNRSYLLVVIDHRTRFPEVEIIGSTAAISTLGAHTKIFSTHGLPHKVISDNGSQFQSYAFKQYMLSKGKNRPWKEALYNFLLNYHIAVHTTTNISPSEALYKRKIRGKVPSIDDTPNMSALRNLPRRDQEQKQKMKRYFDKRYHVTENDICPGDYVLVKQRKRNKLSSRFDPQPYRITHRQGTMLTAKRPGHTIMHNIQHFKFLSKQQPKNFLQGEGEEFDIDEEITHDIPPVNTPPVNMPLQKTSTTRE